MRCQQCGQVFPHRTGRLCGGCQRPAKKQEAAAVAAERLRCQKIVAELHDTAREPEARQLLRRADLLMAGYMPVPIDNQPEG